MRIYENSSSLLTMHIFVVKSVMMKTKIFLSKIESSCNMFCSWLTFLSCWCNNIANDESIKMKRHLFTLLSLRRKERQICRNSNMIRAVLYDFIVKVFLYLKINQYMINFNILRTIIFCWCSFSRINFYIKTSNFWKSYVWSIRVKAIFETLSKVVRTSLIELALTNDLLKKVRIECSMMFFSLLCYALIFSHFFLLKFLNIAIDFRLHLFCLFFVQYMRQFYRTD